MQVTTLEEVLRRFGNRLSLAAIGAIAKKAGALDVRVIFDAMHGFLTNVAIRVRVHIRFLTAADIRAWFCEQARKGGSHLGMVYDVAQPHRQSPVRPFDWGRLACQLEGMAAATAWEARQADDASSRERPRT